MSDTPEETYLDPSTGAAVDADGNPVHVRSATPTHDGAWHYERAESCLRDSLLCNDPMALVAVIAAGQVHATLALAAAQADHGRIQAGMLAGVKIEGYGR